MEAILQDRKKVIRIVAGTLGSLLASGTVLFRLLEDWTWIQSFYFTVTTLTTVGFGDLTPSNDGTRLVTAIFILFGVGIVAGIVSGYGSMFLKRRVQNKLAEDTEE